MGLYGMVGSCVKQNNTKIQMKLKSECTYKKSPFSLVNGDCFCLIQYLFHVAKLPYYSVKHVCHTYIQGQLKQKAE